MAVNRGRVLKENPFKSLVKPEDIPEMFTPRMDSKFDAFSILKGPGKMMHEVNLSLPFGFKGQVLVSCDSSNSKDMLIGLGQFALKSKSKPVFVLLGNNFKTVSSLAEAEGIKDYFIIDTVSKNVMPVSETEKFFFVDSLRNLTEIQIKMLNIIAKNPDAVFIFDSLCVLNLYHSEQIVLKFVYSITKLLGKKDLTGFYVVVKKSMVPKLSQFFDETIQLKKVF
jgi:hypothetical protein